MKFIADINLDALIPLIIGAFWIIAQIAGAAAKKKGAPPRPRAADHENNEDPFAELMRRLGGVQEFKIPTPPEPIDLPDEHPWKPGDIEALPDMTRKTPATAKTIQKTPPVTDVKPIEVPAMDLRPSMRSFRTAMPAMKLPAMSLSVQRSERSIGTVPTIGKIINPDDRRTLRRAMLGHIILGKPRGLNSWSGGNP
ncbi:hypothetical protein [Tichowtungia aerotolerans]|uniref:Uncharacterized protein n=1 Tax=Tichowtungia aerotolerans TaxID=2697043 RepID=A0A6P1M825_9BACT|nr:hypothetical protein [Tichowtungia aerotolerans]QHI70740.1 hypothetical protein GT409_15265 [Tichowtungia aerotolerans]